MAALRTYYNTGKAYINNSDTLVLTPTIYFAPTFAPA